jgi:hypothetical protein
MVEEMTSLNDLKLQVDAAEFVLRQMSDMEMDCTAQIVHCRELRRAMNAECPDGEWYDVYDGNIVAEPV